jgi:hypothetical protein
MEEDKRLFEALVEEARRYRAERATERAAPDSSVPRAG